MKRKLFTSLGLALVFSMVLSTSAFAWVYKPNQTVTAYSLPTKKSDGTTTRTASGKIPAYGMVAVHPKVQGTHSNPIVPFGTMVLTEYYVEHPEYGPADYFTVEDIGDVNYSNSEYWIDVWYGFCTTCSRTDSTWDWFDEALYFGRQTWDLEFNL
ncbi:hypothetical protein ACPV3A_07780 [Paenibacillus sp. Dod16]|uniref:hypothetical protein n=1 Tax=Paenibacillus sp. Dod16 TaxID=3416392 RepID=UPI003CF9B07E